ncbi:MAG: phosphoenolpyruvate synthase [Candidatus Campbellbacteria bacterium]
MTTTPFILQMHDVSIKDVPRVGGKNASLGEMIRELSTKGVAVPGGFVITADAYRYFMKETGMDAFVVATLSGLDTHNIRDLAMRGKKIRSAIVKAKMPSSLESEIVSAYRGMEKEYGKSVDVAVRSSATAEDLPGASFAGEHETYLGIRGASAVVVATQKAMASLFTDRAISYRVDKGFRQETIALSVGVQKMVRSDVGASGVMFSIDTESGFKDAVIINAAWGLGEMVVQGKVTPDEYIVFKQPLAKGKLPIISKSLGTKLVKMTYGSGTKPTKIVTTKPKERDAWVLTDQDIRTLSQWAITIEDHYSAKAGKWTPMDMEWAKDGRDGKLYIVQARPETIHALRDYSTIIEYERKENGPILCEGMSVGSKVATGTARVILSPAQAHTFKKGEVLVTDMTDPDWEPIMKIASAIVTDKGGRTSHAAIVSRELGIPAIVGAGNATRKIKTGMEVTVDTTGSEGVVMKGLLRFETTKHNVAHLPKPKTKVMVNVASPEHAFESSMLPVTGVGLAREEFIIAARIGMHPMALIEYDKQPRNIKKKIDQKIRGWSDPVAFYVDHLTSGVATIAAAFYPRPVIVRFSDFKTNEYRTLLGGEAYEPEEENPMIGWRGASRYVDPRFAQAFSLECKALARVRDEMGFTNVIPMVPFCRTLKEGHDALLAMARAGLPGEYAQLQGLKRGAPVVPVYMMCEIPSNVMLADKFLDMFDGMSIGSNDLTQLTLGLDRDAGALAHIGNENNDAVRSLISSAIAACKRRGKYIGICGQGPSDIPEFATFLVREGIESMSLNPDVVIKTIEAIYKTETTLKK